MKAETSDVETKTSGKPRQRESQAGSENPSSISMKRSTAKAGMISSLSGLVISALFRFKGAKALHICSGWALIGFSVWHCLLNQPKSKGRKI